MAIRITDTFTGETATINDTSDLADTIRPWYPDAPAQVYEVITDFETKLRAGEYYGDEAAYLGLKLEYI